MVFFAENIRRIFDTFDIRKIQKLYWGTKYLLGENSNSYVTENEHIYRVYNLINDTVLKTLEREEEDDDEQALEEAKKYDIVDNVLVRNTMLQISFNSLISGIEQGDYIIPGFSDFIDGKKNKWKI